MRKGKDFSRHTHITPSTVISNAHNRENYANI